MADPVPSPTATVIVVPKQSWWRWTELTLAYLVLRVAVGMLLLISGLIKFKSATNPSTFSTDFWYGTPAEIQDNKTPRFQKIVKLIYENSGLDNPNLVGEKGANFFAWVFYRFGQALPWLFIGSGVMVLLGIFSRVGLLVGSACWISLAAGQMILEEQQWVHLLLFFLLLTVAALGLVRHNRLSVDHIILGLFRKSETPPPSKPAGR